MNIRINIGSFFRRILLEKKYLQKYLVIQKINERNIKRKNNKFVYILKIINKYFPTEHF